MDYENFYRKEVKKDFFTYHNVPLEYRTDVVKDEVRKQVKKNLDKNMDEVAGWSLRDGELKDLVRSEIENYLADASGKKIDSMFAEIPADLLTEKACVTAVEKNLNCYYDVPITTEAIEQAAADAINRHFDLGDSLDDVLDEVGITDKAEKTNDIVR